MDESPWDMIGNLQSLQHRAPQVFFYEVNFYFVPFWIQLHGLPLEVMSTANVAKVATKLGEVLEIENPKVGNMMLRTFFQVRVLLNITKTPPTDF